MMGLWGVLMAKRRHSDPNRSRLVSGADVVRADVYPRILFKPIVSPPILSDLEDRRRFHPDGGFAPALTFSNRDQRRIVSKAKAVLRTSGRPLIAAERFGFAVPKSVAVCVRRKQRREVLHAKGLKGRGGAGRRRWHSDIDC